MLNQLRDQRPTLGPAYDRPLPVTWRQLRDQVRDRASLLSAPQPGVPGLCAVCRGPAGRGSSCCFQCDLHRQCAPGALAATVVPVAYAVKSGWHALNLWQYKSERLRNEPAGSRGDGPWLTGFSGAPAGRTVAGAAAEVLRALLLVFLRDHGACVWRAAGMPAGPTHLAVVPTARGRPGVHPLRALIAPYLACQWAELSALPGAHPVRDLDPARFAAVPVPQARVLLLDDTWATGSTAQSAVLALRRAGAESVAIVVLGRHITAGPAGGGRPGSLASQHGGGQSFWPGQPGEVGAASMAFRPEVCAVHDGRA